MIRPDGFRKGGMALIGLALTAGLAHGAKKSLGGSSAAPWRDTFAVDKAALTDTGRNPYFVLEPGYRLTLQKGGETLIVSVLEETRVVDGVKTRVVEERESKDGRLVEVSRNYFAIDPKTRDLYYFGETVDIYKNGKVSSHGGAWLAGKNGARFGMMLPGKPAVGARYRQEVAPGVAMDRAEVVSVTERFRTPAGTFQNCLRTREGSSLEKDSEEKLYAPEVGLIKDANLVLVRVEKPKP